MKLELIIILLSTLNATVCEPDQLASLPLATQFQPATKIVGSVNNVKTYTQNRKECVKPVAKKQIVQPVSVPVVKKQVVKSNPKPSQSNYSSSLKFIRPSQVVQKSTSYIPPPSYNPPIRLVPIVVKPRPETSQQKIKPPAPPVQYVTPPAQYVSPPTQFVPPPTQFVSPPPQFVPSPTQYVSPPPQQYIPPPQYIPPVQYVPPQQYVPSPPVPQFIPLNLLCNMNVLPPLPECTPHKIAVPIVNLQEMPKMAVPQSIVPKIVQNKGIHDVELIKVINGISLIELRRLNKVVGGIYAIVNHLSTEVEKQKAETKQMKNQMMRQAYGSVLCADNPYTQTFRQNQGKLCFKVIVDDKVNRLNGVSNVGTGSVSNGYSLVPPTNTITPPPIQPPSPSFPSCSSKNLKGPCIFIENSNLEIRSTENESVSISCTKKDNGGVCIDSDGIKPTPLEEKIVVTTSTTVGDRNGRDNSSNNLNNNGNNQSKNNGNNQSEINQNNNGNDNINNGNGNINNALPVQHAIGKHGYLEDETIKPTYHFEDEIVNAMDRSIKLEGDGHSHGNGNREGHDPENLHKNENGGPNQGSSQGNGGPNQGSSQGNEQNGKNNHFKDFNNNHRPHKHHHDHYPQDHFPRDKSFKNHSDFWNSTLGNKDDPPYSYGLLDDPQYYRPSLRQGPLLDVLLGSGHAYHRNHWKNVLRELTRNEPFYGDYPTEQNEDYRNLMRRISSSDVCSGVSDKNSCLKIYNYLLMSSKPYLSSSLMNNLLNQNLSKEEFADDLNKMIIQLILQQRNKLNEDEEEPESYDEPQVGRTGLYGSCSLGEAEVSPGRCMTVMKMSDLIRGEKFNDCDYSSEAMTCTETSPRMSTFFLSDLLS